MTSKFEIESFQNNVAKGIDEYKDIFDPLKEQSLDDLLHQTRGKTNHPPEKPVQEAKRLLKNKDVRIYICPALLVLSKDAYEIGKTITAILLPLALSKTISIQLDPIIFSLMAIMISKMGIASLCAEHLKEKSNAIQSDSNR